MALTITFALSGAALIALVASKRLGEGSSRSPLITRLISRGDAKAREFGHISAILYEATKERAAFMFKKQLPLRVRSNWNRLITLTRTVSEEYLQKIRDIKLMRARSEGISEFFDKLNEVERGNGQIEEPFGDSQETEESVK